MKLYNLGCLVDTVSRESSHQKPTFSLKVHLSSPRDVFLGEMISC